MVLDQTWKRCKIEELALNLQSAKMRMYGFDELRRDRGEGIENPVVPLLDANGECSVHSGYGAREYCEYFFSQVCVSCAPCW